MLRMIAVALVASLMLAVVSIPAHADKPRIRVDSDEKHPSIEYGESVGIFSSLLIEGLGKNDGQKFAPAHWKISISNERDKIKIDLVRVGEKQSTLIAVLDENASFAEIQQVVWLVIEVVQHGGVK